jgi:hypothetical protein
MEMLMVQEDPTKDRTTILILGTVRSEKQDLFSKLNSFSLLMVKEKDGRTILNIPAWPVLAALAAFFVVRAIRSRRS